MFFNFVKEEGSAKKQKGRAKNIDLEKPHDLQKICPRSKGSPKSWKKCPWKEVSLILKSESDIGNLPDLEVKKSPKIF